MFPRFQYRLSTLLLLMTLVAACTLPAWRFSQVWWQFRHLPQADVSRERLRSWMKSHPEQAALGQLDGAATQTQESDLPSPR